MFPHYHQQESADCGPACLRMIAKYYGRQYSLEMLREHSFISREGVSMLGISDAAEYLGMHTLGVKVTFEQLANEAMLPCILHWNQNHKDKDASSIGTDICVYLPEENANRYGAGRDVELKIDGAVYSFEVTAVTLMPNSQGECAMKCHSGHLLPWNVLCASNMNVELLTEDKTIFETFFKKHLFN